MAKGTKAFKKFASSGKLKDTIKSRRVHQQKRRKADDKINQRKKQRGAPRDEGGVDEDDDEEGDEDEKRDVRATKGAQGGRAGGVAKNVEELFGVGGLDGDDSEGSELEDLDDEGDEEDDGSDGGEEDEDEEEDDEGLLDEAAMKKTMKNLRKTDPEFFKYLEENDKELLEFGKEGKGKDAKEAKKVKGAKGKGKAVEEDEEMDSDVEDEEVDDDEDEDEDENDEEVGGVSSKTAVTMRMVREWQNGMLKQHSLRSLRKTLLAFRAAAHMNEDENDQGSGRDVKYSIDSAQVFNKIVVTALKFTPVVLAHHIPFKTLPSGKIKTQQPKKPKQSLNRLILSHFSTLLYLIKSLPSTPTGDEAGGLLATAVSESTKLLPWVLGARKHLRAYLKVLLELWSTAGDSVRIASFLAVRKTFIAGDDALKDACLKNTYKSLLPPLRNTSAHTLPSLNLTKNTAAELFALDPARSYPHAFGFIRTLAMNLRTVVRSTTSAPSAAKQGDKPSTKPDSAEAFRAVYNWQYVHAIDFWSQVLASSADVKVQAERGGVESELKPLIYPLTQIALGVIRLLPSSRYFPLRFHLLKSLLRIITRTGTYIPLSPFLLEILDSAEFRRSNPKKMTLKPLDLEYVIRAPAAYPKTRIFQETLGDELTYLLAEYHTAISTHVAFPEMVLPVILTIKRHLKKGSAGSAKVQAGLKTLVEKLEATKVWVEGKRRGVSFAPRDRGEVGRFAEKLRVDETPVGNWTRVTRKVREQKRREVERALREERDEESEEEGSEEGEMEIDSEDD